MGEKCKRCNGTGEERKRAPRYSINKEQGLYVFNAGGVYSCLGFENAERRLQGLRAWLRVEPSTARPGTWAHFKAYNTALRAAAGAAMAAGTKYPGELTPALIGLEGKRVEVRHGEEVRRFWVGKSSGWCPIHLEISNSRSTGGGSACIFPGDSVRVVNEGPRR